MSDLAQAFMSSQVRLTPEQRRQQMCELLRNKGIICRDFLLAGACPRAPMCPYMHIRDGETRAVPWKVCSFYNNSKCLRDRCSFFHGTQADLDALHASGAEVYRPQDYMRVDVPPTEYFVDNGRLVGNTALLLPVTHAGAPAPTTTPTVQVGRKQEGNCSSSSGSGICQGSQLYSLRGGNSGTRNSNISNNNNCSNKSNNSMSMVSDIKPSAPSMALAPSTAASAPAAQVRYHGMASSSSTSSIAASRGYGASVTLAPVASTASPSASLSSLSFVQQQQAQQQQQQHTFASFQTYSSATTNSTATSSASPATTSVATTTAYEPIMLLSSPANTTMTPMLDTMASPVATLSSFGPYSYMQSQPPGAFFAAANTSPMSLQQQAQQAQQQHMFSPTQALAMPITAQPSQAPTPPQQQQQQLQPSPFQLQSVAPQGCYYPTQLNTLYIHF